MQGGYRSPANGARVVLAQTTRGQESLGLLLVAAPVFPALVGVGLLAAPEFGARPGPWVVVAWFGAVFAALALGAALRARLVRPRDRFELELREGDARLFDVSGTMVGALSNGTLRVFAARCDYVNKTTGDPSPVILLVTPTTSDAVMANESGVTPWGRDVPMVERPRIFVPLDVFESLRHVAR